MCVLHEVRTYVCGIVWYVVYICGRVYVCVGERSKVIKCTCCYTVVQLTDV